MNAAGHTLFSWLAILFVQSVLFGAGCSWHNTKTGKSFDFSTSHVTTPLVDGFHDTFGPDGAIPLLGPRHEAEAEQPRGDPLESTRQLTLTGYIGEVSRRHPSIEAAEAAVESAQELYPQAIAFADPQFRFLNGPTLFGNASGAHLWRLQAQQPMYAWGKRGARGRVAREQAATAREDVSLARERLRKLASQVYFDYALIEAIRPLAEAEQRVAEEEFHGKQVRLVSNDPPPAGQQEQLQLDRLELDRRIDEFHWSRQETVRRVNLLLGRDANAPLPPPAPPPPLTHTQWNEEELFSTIAADHPALSRAEARCRQAEAGIELARASYYPDFVLVTRFDTNADSFWWPERAFIRPQVGLNVIMPIQRERVAASVRQAEAELRQRRAERQIVERQIRQEVVESLGELQRLHYAKQRLASLATLAERKANALVNSHVQFTSSTDHLQARRQWLKYETDRIKAEYAWQQKVFELTGELAVEQADGPWGEREPWRDRPNARPLFPPPERPALAPTAAHLRPVLTPPEEFFDSGPFF